MRGSLVVLALVALAAAGCGGDSSSSGTTTTAPTEQMTVTAYFLRGGLVSPAHVRVGRTRDVARASLEALVAGAPAGFETELPKDIDDFDVSIEDGTAGLTLHEADEQTPIILVESPVSGDAVTSPLRVSGTANTFEATLQLRLVQDGRKLYEHFVTATSGSGQRGTFEWEIPYKATGAATLEAFEYSAADGSETHKISIPIRLR